MTHRPRILVLDSTGDNDAFQALADQVEIVRADSVQDGIELLQHGNFDGVYAEKGGEPSLPHDPIAPNCALSADELLARVADGIAIVDEHFRILWYNAAFASLSDSEIQRGDRIYQALGCEEIEGPDFCPFIGCLGGAEISRSKLRLHSDRRLEVTVQSIPESMARGTPQLLCLVRDITSEVRQREKLIAIHRAGLELSHLKPDELARMSTEERIALLKANIVQYSERILSFKNLEIRLLDPTSKELHVLLSVGMTDFSHDRQLFADAHNNGVTGFVATTATSYLCDDVLHDPLYIPGAPDARSSLTVPIIYRDRVIGTFNVESPDPGHFAENDREFLEVFAREIAVALNTLELLKFEKQFGGTASFEAIVAEIGVPVDEILGESLRALDLLNQSHDETSAAAVQEALRRILASARGVKTSIHKIGQSLEPDETEHEMRPSILTGRRVLLVDNDAEIRRSAHTMLGTAGCEVDTAKTGCEAMTLLRTIRYDVVLGDIRLPDMNGYEFFANVRSVASETPIALITGFGYDPTHSLVKARQEGLKVVLYKPFRFDRLKEAVEDALNPSQTRVVPRSIKVPI